MNTHCPPLPYWKHPPGKGQSSGFLFFVFVFTKRSFIYLHAVVRGSQQVTPEQVAANDGLPLSHHIHSVRVGWLSLSEAEECGWFSLAVGCLRETHPPSPWKKKKMHQSRVYTKLYTTVWDGKPEAAMPVDNQQPTGLPVLHRIPVLFKANQCCSYVRCDELEGSVWFQLDANGGWCPHTSKQTTILWLSFNR